MRAVRRGALGVLGAGVVLAAIAGCSSPPGSSTNAARNDVGAPSTTAAGGDGANGGGGSGNVSSLDQPPQADGRKVVSTATMSVEVDDVVAAKQQASALVTGLEPSDVVFAEQTSLPTSSGSGRSPASSTLTFKVAPAKFAEALTDLAGLGQLRTQEIKTDDVTQQVIDLDARVKAAEDSEARVSALVARTGSVTELAAIEDQVEKRQADLENLRGQQRTLAARVDLATIVVTLTAKGSEPVKASAGPLSAFTDGLGGGWDAFMSTFTATAAVVGALLPFAWVPLVVLLLVRFRRRRRSTVGADVSDLPPPPAGPTPAAAGPWAAP